MPSWSMKTTKPRKHLHDATLDCSHEGGSDQEEATEESVDTTTPKVALQGAKNPGTDSGVATHDDEIDGDHATCDKGVLKRERMRGIDKSRGDNK